jgi:L-fuconolactonase
VIDSHVHLWDLSRRPQPWIDPGSMGVILRDHDVPELEAEMAGSDVAGAVLVQVLNDDGETADYLELAARSERLVGVVGWVDLLAEDVGDRLDRLRAGPSAHLAGIRHQAQAEADPGAWLLRFGEGPGPAALTSRSLACDLMMRPEQLATTYDVARAHDSLVVVLDHAGKPPVSEGWGSGLADTWAGLVARLGELPNVVCKLSGLTTMADPRQWTVDELRPFVDHLLACFGPARLLFGSDWPVSRRAGHYARTVAAARELVGALTAGERDLVLGGTARRVYRLPRTA